MKTLLVALNAHFLHTNLAIRTLQAARDHHVDILELHINLPFRRSLGQIAAAKPDLICFSCYIWNIDYVLRLCRALKKALPDAALLLGGPEVSYDAEAILAANPAVDCVLSGEGEASFPILLDAMEGSGKIAAVPGLSVRNDRRIYTNPPPPLLPPERWPDVYAGGIAGLEGRILYIETSRGCPYRCAYCLSSDAEPVRALEANEAIRRLTHLADCGAKIIKLVDRTFNFDRARALAIWCALIEHSGRTGLRPTYHFEIGAHLIDDEAADVLRSAPDGLFQIEAGIQSADRKVLSAIGRNIPFERVREGIDRLRGVGGIHTHIDLIAGLPEQDIDSFARSFDEAVALDADHLQLGFLKLLKGSGLRARAGELGISYEEDAPYEVISTRWLSFDELCHLKDVETALEWYGNSGRYRGMMRLLSKNTSPFVLYSLLATRLRENGTLDAGRAELARAEALWDFARRDADEEMIAELIRHDLSAAGLRHELPEALQYEEDQSLREKMRAAYPGVKRIAARRYSFDVERYAKTGEWVGGETVVYYLADGAVAVRESSSP